MIMKKLFFLFLFMSAVSLVYAQYNTGDTQLNASLSLIDGDAKLNFTLFKSDISATYSVPTATIDSWSVDFGMKAGDIYMALEIAKLTKKPADEVVKVYQASKTKGWGAISKELGIKPGSPEFHALKDGADTRSKKGKGKGKRK